MSAHQGPALGKPLHKPYAPVAAALGSPPTVGLDVPITAVFLALFIGSAIGNMTVLQLNNRKGHKFLISGLMFGFSMARITTCVMRIVWANYPTNVSIGIAAQIFVTAGVVLLFVINLIFAQRIVRASHPHFGWHVAFSRALTAIYVLIVVILIMIITVTIQTYYTLNANTRRIDRDVQLFGAIFNAVVSFLPIPFVIGSLLVPRKTHVEEFGTGSWRSKITILLTTAFLLCLGASFRTGTSFLNLRPKDDPAWYQSKACFYFFDLGIDVITVYFYLLVRVDRRFHVPNGSKGVGDYSRTTVTEKELDYDSSLSGRKAVRRRIMTDEEVSNETGHEDSDFPKDEELGM